MNLPYKKLWTPLAVIFQCKKYVLFGYSIHQRNDHQNILYPFSDVNLFCFLQLLPSLFFSSKISHI